MTKRIIIFCIATWQCMAAMAQLGDPRDKFSITATVDGATNTDYRWETEEGQLLEVTATPTSVWERCGLSAPQ
ncbi:MAG: hypothetical protein IJ069_01805 [Prevotella sp.]|nr:hypothetical protein [Prevotella sp.]